MNERVNEIISNEGTLDDGFDAVKNPEDKIKPLPDLSQTEINVPPKFREIENSAKYEKLDPEIKMYDVQIEREMIELYDKINSVPLDENEEGQNQVAESLQKYLTTLSVEYGKVNSEKVFLYHILSGSNKPFKGHEGMNYNELKMAGVLKRFDFNDDEPLINFMREIAVDLSKNKEAEEAVDSPEKELA